MFKMAFTKIICSEQHLLWLWNEHHWFILENHIVKIDYFVLNFQKCLSICDRKTLLKDFVWKSNISDERCYELDTKLEYAYDLSDSTSEDEISDFSSITPYSFEFIWKLSRSPSLSKVLMHQWMKKNKNKAYEFEIHLGVTVENATQWKQGESLLSRYKWNPWKLF